MLLTKIKFKIGIDLKIGIDFQSLFSYKREMMLKKCSKCKLELPREMFSKHSREKDGLYYCCKSCKAKENKTYCDKSKDKTKIKHAKYYENHKQHIKDKTILFQINNPDKVKVYAKNSRDNLKLEVFNYYCDNDIKCQGCGEKELCILTVDHINGGGCKHTREIKNLYPWIKRNNYPEGFQIFCWNCQFRKKLQEAKPKNPTFRQLQMATYVRNIKHEVLEQYGKICLCGESDEIVLTLDHVNNDGAEHRRLVGKRGFGFYMWLRQNNFPNNSPLQVLCANCQFKKKIGLI
jgi:hypothetical protein